MILLFITRKIDRYDSRVGFVSEWVAEFAHHLDKLIIICQERGDISSLPDNIKIYSLGKEKNRNKFSQLLFLYYFIFKFLKQVDGVFSHMMPVYSIIVGPFCKIFKKKLIQWYTHKSVDWRLKFANLFVDEFITASPESFHLKTLKPVHAFGHGIDTDFFKPKQNFNNNHLPNNIYNIITVGRISPSKDYESMIKSVYALKEQKIGNIKLTIIGAPALPDDFQYLAGLKQIVNRLGLASQVSFLGGLPQKDLISYLQNSDLFISLSNTGSLDKAVLEAMSASCLVLTSNTAFMSILPVELFTTKDNPNFLAEKISALMNLPIDTKNELKKTLRQEVIINHNLKNLVQKIITIF